MKQKRFLLLYGGLLFLACAFLLRHLFNGIPMLFEGLLGIAILLKILFLFATFRKKGIKSKRPLIFILLGVALILTASNLRGSIPSPLYFCMFGGALVLKIYGIILLILHK